MAASSSTTNTGEECASPSENKTKFHQYLVDIVNLDHNYCRPWSEREKIPHARPAKELFSSQTEKLPDNSDALKKSKDEKLREEDELIDVETVGEEPVRGPGAINMQYDVIKSKIVMSECEKYAGSASSKRTPDTWEELICRTGWTSQQNVLFDKILKIVSAYRLAWLTYEGSPNEPILRRLAVDKATKRVRQILSRIEWDTKLTTWLHSSMVDGLSIPLLACYLDIIQTLRSKVPTLVDKMLAGGATHRRVSPANSDNLTALMKRPWEATVGLTSFQRPRKITGTPLLLIVPSGPTTSASGNSTKRSRFWHHHLSLFGKVIPVTMHLSNSGRGVSIGQCLDHMIGAVQAKVLELKSHFPNRPVVLIGWATGALVSFQVSLKESVCAVVCLGFPLLGVDGLRGGAGDPFLESKAPTMFVLGTLSTTCSQPDIEEFRTKLLADTSLLVVPGADDQLRLSNSTRKREGVTQSVVDRRIMDDIGDFLNQAVNSMNDDSHPRLNYFDFDEVDNTRKKPKTEYRKRPAGEGAGAGPAVKKPRGRTPKAANGEGPKKPKAIKTVKKTSVTGQTPGSTVTRTSGSIPIAPLRSAHPSIPGGILQGVPLTTVPISAVPLSGVSHVSIPGVHIPGVNIPVSGVNVPVSAVIKQGSLGGRSFVFPGAIGSVSSSTTQGASTMTTMGSSGSTHHLKIVMNPSTDGGIQVTGLPKSSEESSMQYKAAIVTVPNKPSATASMANSASIAVTSFSMTSSNMTTSALTSALLVPASAKSLSVEQATSLMSSDTSGVYQISTTAGSRPIVVSRSVVTVPKSALASGQAQFIMHQGQLSAVGKQTVMRSTAGTTQQKSIFQRSGVNTASKAQTTLSNSPGTVRVCPTSSTQASMNLARKTSSPQAMPRTIQVGVKRTVTYNPTTSSKTVTVVSRSLPSDALTTHTSNVSAIQIARLKAKLKTIQNLSGVPTSAQLMQLKSTLANAQTIQSSEGGSSPTISKTQANAQSNASVSSKIQDALKSNTTATTTPKSTVSVKSTAIARSKVNIPNETSTAKPEVRSVLSTLTAQSTAQDAKPQTTSKASSSGITVGKPTGQLSTKTFAQVERVIGAQADGKSSAQTTAKLSQLSTTKPSTHFIQVPASASRASLNTGKSGLQNSQTQVSLQSSSAGASASRQTSARVTSVTTSESPASQSAQSSLPSSSRSTGIVTSSATRSGEEQKTVGRAGKGDKADSTTSLKSEDEKLVENNCIGNDVVIGKPRTTRQSVRRLVAAAKLADAQNKHESGEGSKD